VLPRFSAEQKQDFWRNVHGASNPQELVERLQEAERMHSSHTQATFAADQGTYLPLSVYKRRGFDTKLIKQYCTDKKEHPVLGMTYRVMLASGGSSATDSQGVETSMTKGQNFQGSGESSARSSGEVGAPSAASGDAIASTPAAGPSGMLNDRDQKRQQGLAARILSRIGAVLVPFQVTSTVGQRGRGCWGYAFFGYFCPGHASGSAPDVLGCQIFGGRVEKAGVVRALYR
jgi:hypothetical protein